MGWYHVGIALGIVRTEHDWQGLRTQENFEYERIKSTFELSLNYAIDGQRLRLEGRAFQVFGAICFMDLVSEWLTNMFLFVPLVKIGEMPPGNVFWNKWKENILTLWVYKSSIFKILSFAKSGVVCDSRWLAVMTLTNAFWRLNSLSLNLRLSSPLKFPQFIKQYWRCG